MSDKVGIVAPEEWPVVATINCAGFRDRLVLDWWLQPEGCIHPCGAPSASQTLLWSRFVERWLAPDGTILL